jgi:hypothetical protein
VENSKIVRDDNLMCGLCGGLWNRYRIDINTGKQEAVALTQDVLTLRGAVAAELHAKIYATDEREAAKLAGMADVVGAIRGAK